ncbi:MAG: hypothetical protein GY870_08790, partial [archaeon]|nr:hypothetical protein [archaeon]
MAKIKRKTMIILMIFSILAPMVFTQNVKGAWQEHGTTSTLVTLNSNTNNTNPSIAINPRNKIMMFTFTQIVGLDKDIYLSNNSVYIPGSEAYGIPMYDENKFQISTNYNSTRENTTDNDFSQIAISPNGEEVWVVFQGISNNTPATPESDTEIYVYYQNLTASWLKRITTNTIDDTTPQIVALNNSRAFVAWINETTGNKDIDYVQIENGVVGPITTIYNNPNQEMDVQVAVTGDPGSEIIHLSYISNYNTIYYTNKIFSGSFSSNNLLNPLSCANLSMDANGQYIGLTYTNFTSGNIYYNISSDNGVSFTGGTAVSSGLNMVKEPDCYITDFGKMEIYYMDDQSLYCPWEIYSTNNHNGDWCGGSIVYGGDTTNNYTYTSPVIAFSNNTVVGFYNFKYKDGSIFTDEKLYAFGYNLFYNNSNGNYNQFSILNEDSNGKYLVEGLKISYNLSADVDISFKFTECNSGASYSNTTTLMASNSGIDKKFIFFDPDKYIISNQTFDLSITLNQIDDAILKIPFNASELTISYYSNGTIRPHHFYNITSDDIPEGVNCPYELIDQMQIGFGLILEQDPNQRIHSTSTGGGTWEDARSLNSENYADFGLIQMEEDLLYNFTLSTTGTGNTSLTLFKNTDLTLNTTNSANVIAKITNEDSITINHFSYHCEEGGEYFILIQKETMHTQSVDYDFTYRNCPRNMTLS